MAVEEFTDRMRERMPAHRVWHGSATAPPLSRPAHDALWDDMRVRLRVYEQQRRDPDSMTAVRTACEMLRRSAGSGSLIAVLAATGLLIVALYSLFR